MRVQRRRRKIKDTAKGSRKMRMTVRPQGNIKSRKQGRKLSLDKIGNVSDTKGDM